MRHRADLLELQHLEPGIAAPETDGREGAASDLASVGGERPATGSEYGHSYAHVKEEDGVTRTKVIAR